MVKNMHQLEFISVSEDDNILIGASNLINSSDWTGHLWYFTQESDVISGKINETKKHSEYPLPYGVAAGVFLDNGRMLVGNDIGLIAMYGVEQDQCNDDMLIYNRTSRTEHDRSVLSLSATRTTSKFLSSSMDNSVKLWDTETFMPTVSYDQAHTSYVTFVRFLNPDDDNVFVSASFDGSLLLWDCRKSKPAQVISEEQDYRPTHVEWFEDADHLLFIGCDYGTVKLIDLRNLTDTIFVHEFSRGRSVNTLRSCTHNSKKYLSVCGNTRNLKLYQFDGGLQEVYSNESHGDYIQDTAWLSKTRTLISCSWDSQVIKHYPFEIIDSHGDTS